MSGDGGGHVLAGRRILVVEDETLISMLIESILEAHGGQVVGPASRLAEGLGKARSEPLDAAILDVNLGSTTCFPIADLLMTREIPFVFLSGYGAASLPPDYDNQLFLQKPFGETDLIDAVCRCLTDPPEDNAPVQ